MRGSSAASLEAIVRGTRAGWVGAPTPLDEVADELFSVADVIDSSNQMVRLLSDPGRSDAVKESAVRTLLADRVRPETLEIVLAVVTSTWSEQDDLLSALENVGIEALLEQADREGALESVEEELFQVSRLIDGSPELTAGLDAAREDPRRRTEILGRLLDGRVHRVTAALARRAVQRRSDLKPARRVLEFADFASQRRRRLLAIVTASRPLTPDQHARLGRILAAKYGQDVQMNVEVSPDVVGGLRIRVGDDLYDATVLSRLAAARQRLAS
ncbi:F0F1 ATP synthase subunit delta [Brachybacterium sp. EF45031]|uniref:F0F1 ATP synthase subunit delta n=1 Tax=Brachybacterium sillae TaxID=2810536 RepID=UPI00217CF3CE|nr:F0F1 ATP synthase subunit delta [Brachybacterium sillae]MCS6710915.1 F0F1 ATP synthase subunit delta [Brachybacterium sillae]